MTKKIGVKAITCTLLATFLMLSVGPGLVMAQGTATVCFYTYPWWCQGASSCCRDISSNTCCKNSDPYPYGSSADVNPSSETGITTIYGDWNCFGRVISSYGYICFPGECSYRMNSGMWLGRYNEQDVADPGSEKPCNKTVLTDTFQYTFITEDQRRASWVLPMANLTEADSIGPLRDLPAEEQIIWFKSRGATLEVEDHQTTPVPDFNGYSPAAGPTPPHPLDDCQGR